MGEFGGLGLFLIVAIAFLRYLTSWLGKQVSHDN